MKATLFAFALVLMNSASASNYPVDYTMKWSQQTQGPVVVSRAIQSYYGAAILHVYYKGDLKENPGLMMWIRVNYGDGAREAVFPVDHLNDHTLHGVKITGGCLRAQGSNCIREGTPEMKHLLYWAQGYGMTLNELDIQVAFFDRDGAWDSNGHIGGNYHFRFPHQ